MHRPTIKGVEVGEPLDFRSADGSKGILTGHLSKFWVVDSYGETVEPGGFQESIDTRGPKAADRILARYEHTVTVGKATDLYEDETGLFFEAKISDDGKEGTQLRRHLEDRIPYGLSIGFYRRSTRRATDDDPLILDHAPQWIKTLIAAEGPGAVLIHRNPKLVEGSAVSFPAVDNALVESYRSDHLASLLTDLKAGRLSDTEKTLLRDLTDAWLADVKHGKGETPAPTLEPQTAVRNHRAAIALFEAQARLWGMSLDGAHV